MHGDMSAKDEAPGTPPAERLETVSETSTSPPFRSRVNTRKMKHRQKKDTKIGTLFNNFSRETVTRHERDGSASRLEEMLAPPPGPATLSKSSETVPKESKAQRLSSKFPKFLNTIATYRRRTREMRPSS